MEIASEIKAMMARQSMSGAELARELGVSQMWVSQRLRGITPIDLEDLDQIANILGVTPIDLFPLRYNRTSQQRLAALTRKGQERAADLAMRRRTERATGRTTRRYSTAGVSVPTQRRAAALREPVEVAA